jgi:hypothetical protein
MFVRFWARRPVSSSSSKKLTQLKQKKIERNDQVIFSSCQPQDGLPDLTVSQQSDPVPFSLSFSFRRRPLLSSQLIYIMR